MHIVLIDATGLARPGPAGDHGVPALARMARREGHRVSLLTLPAEAQSLPQPWLPVCASGDVVHVFAAAERLPLLADLNRLAPPTVVTVVDLPPAAAGASVDAMLAVLRGATACVVRSRHAALRWQGLGSALAVRTLPRGIDLLALMPAARLPAPGPADDASGDGPPTLVCVGPFDERSGVDTLLRAFAALDDVGLRLHLLGSFDAGSPHGLACSARVAADVRVSIDARPAAAGLAAVARAADLVCLPNLDPLPEARLVHEAAALGLQCLVGDHGAQAEAVRQFGCGMCLAPGDPQAWAGAMAQWLRGYRGRAPAPFDAPLPLRLEEEAFLYEGLYRQAMCDPVGCGAPEPGLDRAALRSPLQP